MAEEQVFNLKGEVIPDWLQVGALDEPDTLQEPVVLEHPDGTASIVIVETGPDGTSYEGDRDDGWSSVAQATRVARMMYGKDQVTIRKAASMHRRSAIRAGMRGEIGNEEVVVLETYPDSSESKVIFPSGKVAIVTDSEINDLRAAAPAQDGGDLGEYRNEDNPDSGDLAVDTGRDFGGDVQITEVIREPSNWDGAPRGAKRTTAAGEHTPTHDESKEGSTPEEVIKWHADRAGMSEVELLAAAGLDRMRALGMDLDKLDIALDKIAEPEEFEQERKGSKKPTLSRETLPEEDDVSTTTSRVDVANYHAKIGIPVRASQTLAMFQPETYDIDPKAFELETPEVREVVAHVLLAGQEDIQPSQAFAQFCRMNGVTELGDLLSLAGALMDYGVEVPLGGVVVPETMQGKESDGQDAEFVGVEVVEHLSPAAAQAIRDLGAKGVSAKLLVQALREADQEFSDNPFV